MKAILIIDVPDYFNIKGAYAHCIVYEGGKHRMWNRIAHIKPLPQKMNAREKDNMIVSIGWNLCLDEILGEKIDE